MIYSEDVDARNPMEHEKAEGTTQVDNDFIMSMEGGEGSSTGK